MKKGGPYSLAFSPLKSDGNQVDIMESHHITFILKKREGEVGMCTLSRPTESMFNVGYKSDKTVIMDTIVTEVILLYVLRYFAWISWIVKKAVTHCLELFCVR